MKIIVCGDGWGWGLGDTFLIGVRYTHHFTTRWLAFDCHYKHYRTQCATFYIHIQYQLNAKSYCILPLIVVIGLTIGISMHEISAYRPTT